MGRKTRRAEGMNTPLDFSAPVLSRSVDLTNAQDSWWFSVLVTRTPWSYAHGTAQNRRARILARSHTLGAPSSSPHRIRSCWLLFDEQALVSKDSTRTFARVSYTRS